MKQLLVAVAAAVLVGIVFGKDKPDSFESTFKGEDGGPKKAAEVVIQSEKEWKAFVETCQSADVRKKLEEAKVDFTKETIVAVAIGPNGSKLTVSELTHAGVQKVQADDGKAIVEYCVVDSDARLNEPLYPLHVVKMPKVKSVTFKKTEKTFGG